MTRLDSWANVGIIPCNLGLGFQGGGFIRPPHVVQVVPYRRRA